MLHKDPTKYQEQHVEIKCQLDATDDLYLSSVASSWHFISTY